MTTKDIARIAGVSVSTVSRSLNDNPRISVTTRARIKKIAADLDFEMDASARSLSTKKSGSVALVVPASLGQFSSTLYVNLLVYEIRMRLAARGLDCIVTEARGPSGESNLRRLVLQRKVDGVLLLLESTRPEDWSVIKKRGVPVVQVHFRPDYIDPERIDYYFTDNLAGGRLAAGALIDAGCSKLACVMDGGRTPEMEARERGFFEELRARGLKSDPRLSFETDNGFEAVYVCVRKNAARFRRADGAFATTDIMAMALLRALEDEGIRVPSDFKVVGYDDLELCSYLKPKLSSVHQPREEIAALACGRLAALLGGGMAGPTEGRLIAPRYVCRESC
jgi:LacI family transcriptional regulator